MRIGTVMHDSVRRRLGVVSCCSALLACAGEDTPLLDADARKAINDIHVLGKTASTPGGGGEAGSSNLPPNTGDDDEAPPRMTDAGGAGGPSPNADAGSMGGGGGSVCDGFAVLKSSCGNGSFCHGSGSMVSSFADTAAGAASFAGKRAQGGSCSSNPGLIFNPDNPADSLVLTKLSGPAPCGGTMPLGAAPDSLPEDDVACIEEWIGSL